MKNGHGIAYHEYPEDQPELIKCKSEKGNYTNGNFFSKNFIDKKDGYFKFFNSNDLGTEFLIQVQQYKNDKPLGFSK